MIHIIKVLNLAAAFFLEIAMIISFGYFGYHYPQAMLMKYLLMIGLPLIAAILWGFLAAPKSKYRLQKLPRLIFALTLFGAAIFLLNSTGKTTLAAVFAILVVINQMLLFILEE
ncbi:MAG TPA: YrdB family protein [Hanamia sp.]|nr:YrdB family protein [Hanamia sp.]